MRFILRIYRNHPDCQGRASASHYPELQHRHRSLSEQLQRRFLFIRLEASGQSSLGLRYHSELLEHRQSGREFPRPEQLVYAAQLSFSHGIYDRLRTIRDSRLARGIIRGHRFHTAERFLPRAERQRPELEGSIPYGGRLEVRYDRPY